MSIPILQIWDSSGAPATYSYFALLLFLKLPEMGMGRDAPGNEKAHDKSWAHKNFMTRY
ncbi:MAG: hypothetical protein ACM3Q2_10645 [Syntrophothermus sp.]